MVVKILKQYLTINDVENVSGKNIIVSVEKLKQKIISSKLY